MLIQEFTAVVVDDEKIARINLTLLLKEYCPEIQVIKEFDDGDSALKFLLKNKVDILFLDIKMPIMNGFEMLRNLTLNKHKVVFVSAYDDYGIEAIKAGAFDYLLKPISILSMRTLVSRLKMKDKRQVDNGIEDFSKTKISVPSGQGFKVLDINSIVRIESDNSYCQINLSDNSRLVVSCSIKEFETKLFDKGFFRVHNQHLIHLKFLENFSITDGGVVTMVNGDELPVSRRKLSAFKAAIKLRFISPK